jgi:hypothetical protein
MKKLLWSLFAAFSVSLGIVEAASAQPSDVQVYNVSHSGTGCPIGTVDTVISPSRDAVSLGFDAFVAQTAPPVALARKNCRIVVDLRFDPAWSFTVFRVDYRGFAGLEAGVLGQQRSSYSFLGQPPAGDAFATTSIFGRFFDNYSRSDNVGLLVWSPCNGNNYPLVINTEVRVQGSQGLMTVDSVTGKVIQTYDLRWRKCS